MSTENIPTLIHLQDSSSSLILWLLEELGVEYNLKKFDRGAGQAPPELKETHPQGKSPQLILGDGRVITQVSAITLYLLRTYDTEHRFSRKEDDPVHEEMLVGLAVADLSSKLASRFMFHAVALLSPFFLRPLFNKVHSTVCRMALDPDIEAIMGVLETEITGKQWFMGGDAPSRPDFILHFSVDLAVKPKYIDLNKYPAIKEWMMRCEGREAWKRALELGGSYDLDFPAKW